MEIAVEDKGGASGGLAHPGQPESRVGSVTCKEGHRQLPMTLYDTFCNRTTHFRYD